MSDNKTFTQVVQPPEEDEEMKEARIAVREAQQKVLTGLKESMADSKLATIKELAPLNKFTINDVDYDRKKLKPRDVRAIRKAEREYLNAIKQEYEDPDERLDLDYKLLAFKAEKYLGMTKEQFEETDIEYLGQVLEATELRGQGFR